MISMPGCAIALRPRGLSVGSVDRVAGGSVRRSHDEWQGQCHLEGKVRGEQGSDGEQHLVDDALDREGAAKPHRPISDIRPAGPDHRADGGLRQAGQRCRQGLYRDRESGLDRRDEGQQAGGVDERQPHQEGVLTESVHPATGDESATSGGDLEDRGEQPSHRV
jgi:hypothetical protein